MRVIGTAGHVDHGKSTLVEALTGVHPDRLKEEREREMTIDLGFAWLTLPNGDEIGVVDVPGHRDFIENMLSGIGGIDAVLFVVAADEGVMPQTREHLSILDLLQVQSGVVALTKIDLIDDPEWLHLVEDEVRAALAGSVLADAPIQRVSARTKTGIDPLRHALQVCLAQRPPRPDLSRPRLPIDRIFTISGFGTVVTGTLSDGSFRLGDDVVILPSGLRGRVRGLQTHKRKEELAVPGSRTAVNISGVDVDQVQRGQVVTHPGDYTPTTLLDVRFRLLSDVAQPLQHNTSAKLFVGAAEVLARIRLLGVDTLKPGETGWLQLVLGEPVVVVRGDHYILRRPSPGETLGGGVVADAQPKGLHKRFAPDTLARLEALERGTPAEVLMQALLAVGAAPLGEVLTRSNLDSSAARQAIEALASSGQLLGLEAHLSGQAFTNLTELVTSQAYWNQIAGSAVSEVEAFHQTAPLRRGMSREALKSRLKLPTRLFNAVLRRLETQGALEENGPLVLKPGHAIRFTPQQQKNVDRLLARFAAAPYAPPTVKDCAADIGEELFSALVDLGDLVFIPPEVVFRKSDYERMVTDVRRMINQKGAVTAAEMRDAWRTSRRYVLALLEHLDAIGVTVRDGDARRLKGG